MAAAAKKQPELRGMERPTNEALEEVFGEFLAARETEKQAKQHAKDTRSIATEKMREVADQLDRDDKGRPCYVYHDGEERLRLSLSTKTEIKVKRLTDEDDGADVEEADIG